VLKLLGACVIVGGCGTFGFWMAALCKKEESILRELLRLLDYMECELQFRLSPLPELFRLAAAETNTILRQTFLHIAQELESQISPDVACCVQAALSQTKPLPQSVNDRLLLLGRTSGRFELNGQLAAFHAVREECREALAQITRNKDERLRCYQTLGLCAGAALAILLV